MEPFRDGARESSDQSRQDTIKREFLGNARRLLLKAAQGGRIRALHPTSWLGASESDRHGDCAASENGATNGPYPGLRQLSRFNTETS